MWLAWHQLLCNDVPWLWHAHSLTPIGGGGQVSGQLAWLSTVTAIGFAPSVFEIHAAWKREGQWLRVALADWVCGTTTEVFAVGHGEVSTAWDTHGLGPTATYAEAFGMLSAHADGRVRRLAGAFADKLDNVPGVPTVVAKAAERVMIGVATVALSRVLLTPQTMLQSNPALARQAMTKQTCLKYLNKCGESVTEALRTVILGEVNPFAYITDAN